MLIHRLSDPVSHHFLLQYSILSLCVLSRHNHEVKAQSQIKLCVCCFSDDDDSLENNTVEQTSLPATSELGMSMNFYHQDNNVNKVPQSKMSNGDAILNAAILQHQRSKVKNGSLSNGRSSSHVESKPDNFAGLPTTEI